MVPHRYRASVCGQPLIKFEAVDAVVASARARAAAGAAEIAFEAAAIAVDIEIVFALRDDSVASTASSIPTRLG